MKIMDFAAWIQQVNKREKITADPESEAWGTMLQNAAQEASVGVWNTVHGTVTIANRELCWLIWLACAENWTSHLAHSQGRTDDAQYHADKFHGYINEIYADTFTKEEQDGAWTVLD